MERRHGYRSTLALAALVAAAPAGAVPRQAAAASCTAEPGGVPVIVAAVSDDLDVTLADGRLLRLAGIDAPRAAADGRRAEARRVVEAWGAASGGGPPVVRPLSAAPDRWGRVPALMVRDGADTPTAAEALVRAGLARARPEAEAHACFPAVLAAEAEARAARRGLWADPRNAVLAAADADGLAAQAGGMAVVEGVLHLHEGRGGLYLALGRDRRGFVAVVSRRDAQRFAKAGLDLHDYEGTPVRLRGDLDARFGPRMRVTDPDAVESLEPGSLPDPPDAKHWTARAPDR